MLHYRTYRARVRVTLYNVRSLTSLTKAMPARGDGVVDPYFAGGKPAAGPNAFVNRFVGARSTPRREPGRSTPLPPAY